MSNFGLKISQPGKNVITSSGKNLIYSSEFKTLRVFKQGNSNLTVSNRTITIPHGLGYVPLFLVHTQTEGSYWVDDTDYVISPHIPIVTGSCYLDRDVIAWADRQSLYVKAQDNFGVSHYSLSSYTDAECQAWEDDFGSFTGDWVVGNEATTGQNVEDGAVRFGNIGLTNSQSIYAATLNLYIEGRVGSGEVKMTVYGIDEDNTANFNTGTAATARTKTTASTNSNSTLVAGNTLGINVKSIVEEIISRAGWTSGNAMGFILNDNGTTANNDYYGETYDTPSLCSNSNLEIIPSNSLANFKYTIFLNKVAD